MNINKNNLKLILNLKNNVENLFEEFTTYYNDIFVKKELFEYDQIFSLDLATYTEYNNFIDILLKLDFKVDSIKDEHIKSIINNLVTNTQLPPDEMRKTINFDHLYYSYVLCQLYIIIPYILEAYFQEEYKIKHPNWHQDKIEYKVKINKLTKHLSKTIKCFESWDRLEDKIDKFNFEITEKHPESKSTYLENHHTFAKLMNNFILVKNDLKLSNKMIVLSKLNKSWYWILLIGIFIIVCIVLIILYTQK